VQISATMVKDLRDRTGVGPLDCKKALELHDGDMEAAARYLREKGLAKADKKATRTANDGIVQTYQHFTGRIAVIVEVNCETDFVAKTDAFTSFARDIALHIANMAPKYVKREDVPASILAAEREIQRQRVLAEGKPEPIADKIVEGRLDKFYEEIVLLEQPFIKDDTKTVEELRKELVATTGENIVIRRFVRFELGETESNADNDGSES
jgi:elongation factor Ts